MTVRKILESEPRDTRCKRLQEAHPDCKCESDSVYTEFSPGPVQPLELLIRILPSPYLWDAKNQVPTSAAFYEVGIGRTIVNIPTQGMRTSSSLNPSRPWRQKKIPIAPATRLAVRIVD